MTFDSVISIVDQIITSWPKIFFEVCSLDRWSRFRPEGYCAITIPHTPGQYYMSLSTLNWV